MADLTQAVADSHRMAPHQTGVREKEKHMLTPLILTAALAGEFRTARPQVKGQPHTVVGKFGLSFNATDPNSVKWVQEHTLELSEDLSETTKKDIADALERALLEGDRDQLYEDVLDAVGSPKRAALIAHHEPMVAAGEGQRQSWDQAIDAGLLDGDERVEWIATADAHTCPVCAKLDGKTRKIDGEYPRPGGLGPPQHVRCRCTEGISADMRGAAGFDEDEHPRAKDGKFTKGGGESSTVYNVDKISSALNKVQTGSRLIIGKDLFKATESGWMSSSGVKSSEALAREHMSIMVNNGLLPGVTLTPEQEQQMALLLAEQAALESQKKEKDKRNTPLMIFTMAAVADWVSTDYMMSKGGYESNPTINWLHTPTKIIAAGAGIDVVSAYAWMKATKNHTKIQAAGLIAMTVFRGYLAVHNVRMFEGEHYRVNRYGARD